MSNSTPSRFDVNDTHDPNLKSWVEFANDPATDFPIQNLPFCSFTPAGHEGDWYGGLAIGDRILDLDACDKLGLTASIRGMSQVGESWDWVAQYRSDTFHEVRRWAINLLRWESRGASHRAELERLALHRIADCTFMRPLATTPNYTDFYASKHHATTVGSMFRPDNPLLPNYTHIPIAYHGRASSIVPSGTPIRRPHGQQAPPDDNSSAGPSFGPCKLLDYEMELGLIIGRGNDLGHPIPIDQAPEHILGLCIVNDWSARDLQKWEYQPLGPFLAKNFATTISPYIVTLEALAPFRIPGPQRDPGDPQPLPYLRSTENWGLDITVEVHLSSKQMRDRGLSPIRLSKGSFKDMYWTIAQMVTHHASNGCNLQPGDLLASGTISGPEPTARGCLLELTWQGTGPDKKPLPRKPIQLPTGETRLFLQDGDEVIMKAYCERDGYRRIGFGECRGLITPAEPRP